MHIVEYQGRVEQNDEHRRQELRILVDQPTDKQKRPCPGCDVVCSCHRRSQTCCCRCSPECPDAAEQLSSEPAEFPIEPGVLPLVYELNALRVVETCWSCEGHDDDGHGLMRSPQVWFYSPCSTYAELIARHVATLRGRNKLAHPWVVVVDPYETGGPATTFILKPDLSAATDGVKLRHLHRDLLSIADALPSHVGELAKQELRKVASEFIQQS